MLARWSSGSTSGLSYWEVAEGAAMRSGASLTRYLAIYIRALSMPILNVFASRSGEGSLSRNEDRCCKEQSNPSLLNQTHYREELGLGSPAKVSVSALYAVT